MPTSVRFLTALSEARVDGVRSIGFAPADRVNAAVQAIWGIGPVVLVHPHEQHALFQAPSRISIEIETTIGT